MSEHRPDLRRLFAFLDGRLPTKEQLELRLHLESCPACKAQLATLSRTRAGLRALGERMPAPPARNPVAEAKLLEALRVRGAPRAGVQWWWLPVTAAATLLLAVLVLPRLRTPQHGGPVAAAEPRAAAASAHGVAVVVSLRGQVEFGPTAAALHAGRAGDELPGATVLRTGADGEVRLSLAAGGELTLAADGTVGLPDDTTGVIRLETGAIDVHVTPRAENERPFGIETPLARIEAIGTRFHVLQESAATTVDVTEGKVRFVSLRSAEEHLVTVGQAARADDGGRVTDVPFAAVRVASAAPVAAAPQPAEVPAVQPAVPAAPAAEAPDAGEEPAEQSVRITHPHGTIDGRRVMARVSHQRGQLQACYNEYVMRVAPQPVEARTVIIVLEDGSVGSIDVNLSVDDATLERCVERVFRSIHFPRPQGGPARVNYPVQLSL